jgi:hypothetical protein
LLSKNISIIIVEWLTEEKVNSPLYLPRRGKKQDRLKNRLGIIAPSISPEGGRNKTD